MKKIEKIGIKEGVVWVIVILSVFLLIRYGTGRNQSLRDNREYIYAVITDFGQNPRGRGVFFRYKFFVDEKKYTGRGSTFYGEFSIGDTVVIVFDRTNPNNNRTPRDLERVW